MTASSVIGRDRTYCFFMTYSFFVRVRRRHAFRHGYAFPGAERRARVVEIGDCRGRCLLLLKLSDEGF